MSEPLQEIISRLWTTPENAEWTEDCCFDTVHDEVHHKLLQLHAISHDPGKICRQLRPN
jgi:hypothetical protein